MPGSSELRDKLKNLSPEQIKKLMSGNPGTRGSGPSLKMPRNDNEEYPVSKNQQWFWFLTQVNEEPALVNIPLAVELNIPFLDITRFTSVINQLICDNEILRTTFELKDGDLIQKIHPPWQVQVEYEEVQSAAGEGVSDILKEIALKHGMIAFDLERLPLFAVKVVKVNESGYVVLFNLHHMISDGWTNSLLARDTYFKYGGINNNPANKYKYQYVDYVQWEMEWMKSPVYEKGLLFWQRLLSNLPEHLYFPRDFRDGHHSYKGRMENYPIPPALKEKVTHYCVTKNITPFEFYISCYALLLGMYTGENDLIIGTPAANRNQRYFQNTYGLFINPLPVRFKIEPDISFDGNLDSFTGVLRNCLEHQEVPFTEIVHAVNPQRDINDDVLYSVHFVYQHFPQRSKEYEYALLPFDYKVSKFDLNFWIVTAGEESEISLTYKNGLFSQSKIKRFIRHYMRLIEGIIDNPGIPVCELKTVPREDQSVLNGHKTDENGYSWRDLFDNSCRNHAEDIAIADELGTLSYKDLNNFAASMSAAITKRGIRKGDVVIINTERNRHFIISLLACFKCGAVYLPVSDRDVESRLDYIYKDSRAKLIIAEKPVEDMNTLCVGEALKKNEHCENVHLNSDDDVYIIYTSGSTGKPKGVVISHGALLNYVMAVKQRFNDEGIRSFAHVSALNADLGNTSIYSALGFGGLLALPGSEFLVDPILLESFFKDYPVDALKIVPSHLNAFSEHLDGILPQKLLVCGGEQLSPSLIARIREIKPALRIINHYGPTETTIGALTYEVPVKFKGSIIPVGKPLDNTDLVIIDDNGNIVPQGVTGEICLGGNQLAKGYLYRPEQTQNVFNSINGSRYYRTGDLGYINENKDVVFRDRKDRQVKINGFRVELGELESIIKSYPGIINASVFIVGEDDYRKKICAAVVTDMQPDFSSLKDYLKHNFSAPLTPVFLSVDEIPVTKNGKVDHQRLNRLYTDNEEKPVSVLPRDVTEITLIELFRSALNVPTVQLDDNFFDMGGHSLLAISFIQKINNSFQTDFNISILFEYGSVRELAVRIRKESKNRSISSSPFVSLVNKRNPEAMVWIHPAGGNVMSYYPVAQKLSKAFDGFAFTAVDDHSRKNLSITGLADEYNSILKSRNLSPATCLAGWSMGALIAHEMAVSTAKTTIRPLILVDQPVPNPETVQNLSFEARLGNYLEKIEIFTGKQIKRSKAGKKAIDFDILIREFQRLNLVPEEVSVSDFKHFLDILVKHNNIISEFKPSVYHGPVLLVKAREKVMLKTNNPQPEYFLEDLGWGKYCTNLKIVESPGNHINMLNGENTVFAADIIREWISGLHISSEV